MTDFIEIYDNAVSEDYCRKFISFINYLKAAGLCRQEDNLAHNRDHASINFPHALDYDLSSWDPLANEFIPTIQPFVDDYCKKYSILTKSKFLVFDVKAKKIPVGGGFHDWHYENMGIHTSHRRFVIQLYLNDNFEAGETEFLYINKRINAKTGRLIMFPSGYTHTHRGNPPINDDKYILTSWGLVQS